MTFCTELEELKRSDRLSKSRALKTRTGWGDFLCTKNSIPKMWNGSIPFWQKYQTAKETRKNNLNYFSGESAKFKAS